MKALTKRQVVVEMTNGSRIYGATFVGPCTWEQIRAVTASLHEDAPIKTITTVDVNEEEE